jgi:hypothetical protein
MKESIAGVIGGLNANLPTPVVDDGSVDATALPRTRVNVLAPFNVGGAMQTGFYAQQGATTSPYSLTVMASICPQIENCQPVLAGTLTYPVPGFGQGDYKPSFSRKVGIRIFSTILSCILGTRVTDTTSGFRAVNRRVIEFYTRSYPDDYPEVEALVLLHKAGMRIAEVPVHMRERTSGHSSITAARSVYYMVKVLWRSL